MKINKCILLAALGGLLAFTAQSQSKPANTKKATETKKPSFFKRTTKKVVKSKPVVKSKRGVVKASHKVGDKLQKVGK